VEESIRSKVDKAHVSSAFHARNYQEVVRVLGPRLMAAPAPNNAAMPRQERIYLLGLLAEAYRGCGNAHQALLCGQTLLHETVADLSGPTADTRQATLSLLATVRSVPPGTTWLTPLIPDLKELLRTTALQAAAHTNRYTLALVCRVPCAVCRVPCAVAGLLPHIWWAQRAGKGRHGAGPLDLLVPAGARVGVRQQPPPPPGGLHRGGSFPACAAGCVPARRWRLPPLGHPAPLSRPVS
jgi:hypothetical protein